MDVPGPPEPPPLEPIPARVRGRSWAVPAGLVAAIGLGLVGLGISARMITPAPAPTATPGPVAGLDGTTLPSRQRTLPASLDCHDLPHATCARVVDAALAVLPGDVPDVATAGAWGSLLCDSTFDCPPTDLQSATPLGSVIVSFADGGTEAWVNVVERAVAERPGRVTQAWIVAWIAPPAARPSPGASPAG